MKGEIPAEMFLKRSRQITERDRPIKRRREERRLETDVRFLLFVHRSVQKRVDHITSPVFHDDNVTDVHRPVDVIDTPSRKVRCYQAGDPDVIRRKPEPLQVGPLHIECEFVHRLLPTCVDSPVEHTDDIGIVDLSLPLEHVWPDCSKESEMPVGIPVQDRFVHFNVQPRFHVIPAQSGTCCGYTQRHRAECPRVVEKRPDIQLIDGSLCLPSGGPGVRRPP